MCGIAGLLTSAECVDEAALKLMGSRLVHRGPDDSGLWVDQKVGIGLVHRRLSIIDLSSHGHQPMASPSGRYIITYNGEIYNFKALRKEVQGVVPDLCLQGGSDTEVLLVAIDHWGVEEALKRSNGMFAFALWDKKEHCLYLARDRMGEKPFYLGWVMNTFLFASELKALKDYPGAKWAVDRTALTLFLRQGFVPAPWSIYEGLYKLPTASLLRINKEQAPRALTLNELLQQTKSYWSLDKVVEIGIREPFQEDANTAADHLETLLTDAISMRMLADVPLGAFLSGGIDSSIIVALMQSVSDRPVKTFTVGFDDAKYNEADYAKAVADHLGSDHTELYVSAKDALDLVPTLPNIFDEPFADASQIPTFLVSHLIHRYVTVALSGDGGDELFYGYGRYRAAYSVWSVFGVLPYHLRLSFAKLIKVIPQSAWDGFDRCLPQSNRIFHTKGALGFRMHRLAKRLSVKDFDGFYRNMTEFWPDAEHVVIGSAVRDRDLFQALSTGVFSDPRQNMMFHDQLNYLPNDILVKVDRASMAVSLETRIPFLDHRLIEFAWSLPFSFKLRQGQEKWLLKQLLFRHVPPGLVERPKQGFAIPLAEWLRGPLKEWASEMLDAGKMKQQGYLVAAPVQRLWRAHLSGRGDYSYVLWAVLMFQAWLASHHDL